MKLKIQRKVVEACDVVSVYLGSPDGERLSTFLGGQYLVVEVPGIGKREYAISAYSKAPRHYQITVARLRDDRGQDGCASAYWHDKSEQGDLVEASEPAGSFHFPNRLEQPSVVVGAGIGVAPMVAMAEELAVRQPQHPATFLYEVRSGGAFPFAEKLKSLRAELPNASWRRWFRRPRKSDRIGVDFEDLGDLTAAALASANLSTDHVFFVCGPDEFATNATSALRNLGVPDERLRSLGLGPKGADWPEVDATPDDLRELEPCEVVLARSGKNDVWKPDDGVLLDFVERLGIDAPFSCRTGMCGRCMQRVISGDVLYVRETSAPCLKDHALLCSSIPRTSLKLDL